MVCSTYWASGSSSKPSRPIHCAISERSSSTPTKVDHDIASGFRSRDHIKFVQPPQDRPPRSCRLVSETKMWGDGPHDRLVQEIKYSPSWVSHEPYCRCSIRRTPWRVYSSGKDNRQACSPPRPKAVTTKHEGFSSKDIFDAFSENYDDFADLAADRRVSSIFGQQVPRFFEVHTDVIKNALLTIIDHPAVHGS